MFYGSQKNKSFEKDAKDVLRFFHSKIEKVTPTQSPRALVVDSKDLKKKVKSSSEKEATLPKKWFVQAFQSQEKNRQQQLSHISLLEKNRMSLSEMNGITERDCSVLYKWLHDPEPKSCILYGNTGVGKTHAIKCLDGEHIYVDDFSDPQILLDSLYTRSLSNPKLAFIVDDFDTMFYLKKNNQDIIIPKNVRILLVVTMVRHSQIMKMMKMVDLKVQFKPQYEFRKISKQFLLLSNGDIRSALLSAGKKDTNDNIFSLVKNIHLKYKKYGNPIMDIWLELEPNLKMQFFYFLYKNPDFYHRVLNVLHFYNQDDFICLVKMILLGKPLNNNFQYDTNLASYQFRLQTERPVRNSRYSWKHFMNCHYFAK